MAKISSDLRFLNSVTPLDLAEASEQFRSTGDPPRFEYAELAQDPQTAQARLADLVVHEIADPAVAELLAALREELFIQTQMLACRGSEEFLALSIELSGSVSSSLLDEARRILDEVPLPSDSVGPTIDAAAFAGLAEHELDHYRRELSSLESSVEVSATSTGLMVTNGDLLVAPTEQVPLDRVEALIQHEIGVHVVTQVTGSLQPLRTLAHGLAGYEATQEGLGVLAEHLVGGLTAKRLRELAARVVAVHDMVEGAGFVDVDRTLRDLGFSAEASFTAAMRVFRSGGLTKDAGYLRGLGEIVEHLRSGGSLDGLWLGKMSLAQLPLVEDLHRRGVLVDPALTPRFLEFSGAQERLERLTEIRSLTELVS